MTQTKIFNRTRDRVSPELQACATHLPTPTCAGSSRSSTLIGIMSALDPGPRAVFRPDRPALTRAAEGLAHFGSADSTQYAADTPVAATFLDG